MNRDKKRFGVLAVQHGFITPDWLFIVVLILKGEVRFWPLVISIFVISSLLAIFFNTQLKITGTYL